MRMSFWLLLCLALFYTTLERFGFDNTNARLLHDGLVARFMGKLKIIQSNQINGLWIQIQARLYNFFRGGILPGLYEPGHFSS